MTSLVTSARTSPLVVRRIHRRHSTFSATKTHHTTPLRASLPATHLNPTWFSHHCSGPGRHIPNLPPFHISTFPLSCEFCKALLAMILLFFPNQLVSEAPSTRDRQQQQQQATNSEGVLIGFFCILFFGTFGKEEAPALFEPFCLLLYYFFLILQVRYQYITYPPQSSIAIS